MRGETFGKDTKLESVAIDQVRDDQDLNWDGVHVIGEKGKNRRYC